MSRKSSFSLCLSFNYNLTETMSVSLIFGIIFSINFPPMPRLSTLVPLHLNLQRCASIYHKTKYSSQLIYIVSSRGQEDYGLSRKMMI